MNGYELYNIAKKHIGEDGSRARAYCNMTGGAWCNAYVCCEANEGGVKSLFFDGAKETYCPHSIKWCQSHLAEIPLYLAMPMDIIYFDWNNNKVPDHIGFVRNRIDTSEIYTHEGNTSGGIVDEKKRKVGYVLGVYRPHFKGTYNISKPLTVDGQFDYSSVAMLQKALGLKVDGILGKDTVKALQKKAGVTPDGAWGKNTSKAVQKMVGVGVDGAFGEKSVKALQTWINKNVQFKTDGTKTETVKKETPTPQPSKYGGEFPTIPECKIGEAAGKMSTSAPQVREKKWYSFGQTHCFQFKDKNKGLAAAKLIQDACANNYVLYDSSTKDKSLSFRKEAQKLDWNAKKIAKKVYTACSQLCLAGVMSTGINVNDYKNSAGLITELQKFPSDFYDRTGKSYLTKADNLYEGDILVKAKKHAIMVVQGEHLRIGNSGENVKRLQKFLNWAGFDCGTADGIFGENTLKSVKAFQKSVGLTASGYFGKPSLKKAKGYTK